MRKVAPLERTAPDQRIAWILPLGHGHQRDAGRQPRRQVLEGVNGEVDPPLEQGVVDLPGEEGPAADLREGHVPHHVAGGADLDPLGRVARLVQPSADVLRLPEGEGTAARAHAQRCGHLPPAAAAAGKVPTRAAAASPEAIDSPSATPSR